MSPAVLLYDVLLPSTNAHAFTCNGRKLVNDGYDVFLEMRTYYIPLVALVRIGVTGKCVANRQHNLK